MRKASETGGKKDCEDSLQQMPTRAVRADVITDEEDGHEQQKEGAAWPAPW